MDVIVKKPLQFLWVNNKDLSAHEFKQKPNSSANISRFISSCTDSMLAFDLYIFRFNENTSFFIPNIKKDAAMN